MGAATLELPPQISIGDLLNARLRLFRSTPDRHVVSVWQRRSGYLLRSKLLESAHTAHHWHTPRNETCLLSCCALHMSMA